MNRTRHSRSQSQTYSLSRRNFLAIAGAIPAVAALSSPFANAIAAPIPAAADATGAATGAKRIPIGIELYSVRGELGKNIPNTLRAVAKMGYEVVEFYSPYFSWSFPKAKEIRAILDDLNLRCYSTHNHIDSFTSGPTMAKAIELNQILGSRHIVMASSPGWAKGVEGWKKLADQLSNASKELQPHGLSAGYHNHQSEWAKLDNGQSIMQILADNTPQEFVLQLDVGTCVETGNDPVAWIKSHPGRIKIIHVKDWAPGKSSEEKGYRVIVGEGVSPWKQIIEAAESVGGIEFYLLEQEGSRFSEFETAQKCLDSWKNITGRK